MTLGDSLGVEYFAIVLGAQLPQRYAAVGTRLLVRLQFDVGKLSHDVDLEITWKAEIDQLVLNGYPS